MQVTVYTTPTCPYCHSVKQFLQQRGVPFAERNVAADPNAAAEMVRRTGQQGVPVIVIDNEVIVGFDRPRLEQALGRVSAAGAIRLGAKVADASKIKDQRSAGPVAGAYVGGVKAGSLAARIGLQKDDVIVELAGKPISSATDVESVLRTLRGGQPVTLTYMRHGERQQVQFVA